MFANLVERMAARFGAMLFGGIVDAIGR